MHRTCIIAYKVKIYYCILVYNIPRPLYRKWFISCWVQNTLRWRHNGRDSVSNHQPHHCLLNRLFRRRSKKTSKHRVTGLCVGNSPGPVNSPHKWPVTRKMFPFDDVIMKHRYPLGSYLIVACPLTGYIKHSCCKSIKKIRNMNYIYITITGIES